METSSGKDKDAPTYSFTCKYVSSSHLGFKPMAISVRLNEVPTPSRRRPQHRSGRKKELSGGKPKKDHKKYKPLGESRRAFLIAPPGTPEISPSSTTTGHGLPPEEASEEDWG